MTYTPKSKRGNGKASEKIHGVMDLTCEKCIKKIKQLNLLIDKGVNAVFVTFSKDDSIIHLEEVERTLKAGKG